MNGKLSFLVELKQTVDGELAKIKKAAADAKSSVSSAFSGIKTAMAGAFTATAVTAFARSVLDYVGQIKDASAATGLSTTNFQALSIVAKENGVEIESLVMQLGRIRNIQGSIGSDTQMQDAFSRLGISITEVQTADPDSLLQRIAVSLRETGDASAAFDIFGRGAARLIPVLNELADGWDAVVQRTKGGIISENDIEYIDRMGDSLDGASVKAKSWAASIVGGIADVSAVLGRMSTGKGLFGAMREEGQDRYNQKKVAEAKAAREKELREQIAAREKSAEEEKQLDKAKASGVNLGEQYAKASLSAKDYEARLQERVNSLVAEANREGLSALERQQANNAALEASLELLEAQKRVKAETEAAERKRQADDEQKKRGVEQNEKTDKKIAEYRLSKMSPKDQLKAVEAGISRDRAELNSKSTTPSRRAELVDSLIDADRKRSALRKELDPSAIKTPDGGASRADQISSARDNITRARQRQVGGASLGDVFSRMYDVKKGRSPSDAAAQQTAENTKIIAENTKQLQSLGAVQ